jgi:3-hydroxyisobutyrate dehydrogenase-like beta-hydroxyacid dehydrogenase
VTEFTLGLIGLGSLGEAVARRLTRAGGYRLMVFDIASGPLRYFVMKNDADIAISPRMMAEMCNVIVTALPSAAELRQTISGQGGLAEGFRPGTVLIDLGSTGTAAAKEFATELAAREVTFLEAPVIGTSVDARNGRLVVPVAGDAAAVERVMPVLKTLGEQVVPTGPIGSGAVMAALAGSVRAAATLAAAEALVIAEREGLTAAAFLEFCARQGTLGAAIIEALRPRDTPRSLEAAYTVGAIVSDLDASLALAHAGGLTLRQAELCREIWAALKAAHGSEDDHDSIVRWSAEHAAPKPAAPDAAEPDPAT